jgi:hypothetical protein
MDFCFVSVLLPSSSITLQYFQPSIPPLATIERDYSREFCFAFPFVNILTSFHVLLSALLLLQNPIIFLFLHQSWHPLLHYWAFFFPLRIPRGLTLESVYWLLLQTTTTIVSTCLISVSFVGVEVRVGSASV